MLRIEHKIHYVDQIIKLIVNLGLKKDINTNYIPKEFYCANKH